MTTLFYCGILGLIYLWISTVVIRQRRALGIPYGFGPKQELAGVVSAHSNFSAYVPFILLMTFIAEDKLVVGPISIHIVGISLVIGRLLHFYGLSQRHFVPYLRYRVAGMAFTLLPLAYLALRCFLSFFVDEAY